MMSGIRTLSTALPTDSPNVWAAAFMRRPGRRGFGIATWTAGCGSDSLNERRDAPADDGLGGRPLEISRERPTSQAN
jgi:hypothetical protein